MTQLTDTTYAVTADRQRRNLARITGVAGLVTLVVVLGTSLANDYQSAPFDSDAEESVAFFRTLDDSFGAFSSFATAVGLIAMLWFTLGLALLLRGYEGELPWRSTFPAPMPSRAACARCRWGGSLRALPARSWIYWRKYFRSWANNPC